MGAATRTSGYARAQGAAQSAEITRLGDRSTRECTTGAPEVENELQRQRRADTHRSGPAAAEAAPGGMVVGGGVGGIILLIIALVLRHNCRRRAPRRRRHRPRRQVRRPARTRRFASARRAPTPTATRPAGSSPRSTRVQAFWAAELPRYRREYHRRRPHLQRGDHTAAARPPTRSARSTARSTSRSTSTQLLPDPHRPVRFQRRPARPGVCRRARVRPPHQDHRHPRQGPAEPAGRQQRRGRPGSGRLPRRRLGQQRHDGRPRTNGTPSSSRSPTKDIRTHSSAASRSATTASRRRPRGGSPPSPGRTARPRRASAGSCQGYKTGDLNQCDTFAAATVE